MAETAVPGEPSHFLRQLDEMGSMNLLWPPFGHRGELVLDPSAFCADISPFSNGPDTPPPSSGDWIVDQAGNNVNNTTIILNGNLNVTTGDLTLDNVTLVMNCSADGQYGISVSAGGILNVTNCVITAFKGSYHYKFEVSGRMTMDRCNVSEMWGDINSQGDPCGIAVSSSSALIRSSTISRGETSGVQLRGNAAPTIIDTAFTDNGFKAVAVMDSSAAKVTNCTFTGNDRGISVNNTSKPVFKGCTLRGDLQGITVFNSAAPLFSNCTVTGSLGHGIYIADTSSSTVTGCRFLGNNWTGIVLFSTSACAIDNCTASANSECGLQVPGRAAHALTDCVFNGNSGNGLETVYDSDPVLANCTVSGNNQTGIFTSDTSTPVFSGCSAALNRHNGMQGSKAARPTFTDCNFSGNKGCGFSIDTTSSPSILRSTVLDNLAHGAQTIGASRPAITGCTFGENGMCGIQSSIQSMPSITDCNFTGNAESGILVTEGSAPVISGCSFTGNLHGGLSWIDYSAGSVDNSSFINNSGNGIMIIGSARVSVRDCYLSGNKWSGIDASDSSAAVMTGCRAENNHGCGITVFLQCTAALSGCCSTGNAGHGLQVTDSAMAVVSNSTLAGNVEHGAAVYNFSKPSFTGCSMTGNGLCGITVSDSSAPVFDGCSVTGNGAMGIYTVGTSTPVFQDCSVSKNNQSGMEILDSSSPGLRGLTISGNGAHNIWDTSKAPIVLANSTLGGHSTWDVMLSNNSRLTLLNTTYTRQALLTGTAQLKVQWYLTFTVLDRAKRPVPGATVGGTGLNGSLIQAVTSGIDGIARDLVATEYLQNGTGSDPEYTYFGPYDLLITKEGDTNITMGFPVSRTISWRLYFDYAPKLGPLPEPLVTEDQPSYLDLTPYISDNDDPLSGLGISTDKDYAVADNATKVLEVVYPRSNENDFLTVKVSDGMKNCTQVLNLMIIPVNDRPVCHEPIPDLQVLEDETLTINLTDYLWDEENGGSLTFTCNREEIAIDNGLRQATWTPGDGNYSLDGVFFTAFDGYMKGDSNEFNITFIPVNDPPVYLGSLHDKTVQEHKNWTVDLWNYFWDEEDTGGLVFESSHAEISVNNIRHTAQWSPTGNSSYSIGVVFTAHDAMNYSMNVSSDPITLTYLPVNDPPVYLGKLGNARIKPGELWNITLEEQFRDEDTQVLRFGVNNPNVKIIEAGKTRHFAVWKPDRYSTDVIGLVITAYDGKTYVKSVPIDLRYDAPVEPEPPGPTTSVIRMVPWYIYVLVPAGVVAGALAFYAYRRFKYGKYNVEQAFLIYKDGRLLAHRSSHRLPGGGEDIISGMLTALQGFIREFLKDENRGELEEMKYGDLKIVIERGKRVYLAVFLSGYVTDGLRALMKGILDRVDAEMGEALESWDGTINMLKGLGGHLEVLIGEPEAPRKAMR